MTSIIHFIDPSYPGLISRSLWFVQENGPPIAVIMEPLNLPFRVVSGVFQVRFD